MTSGMDWSGGYPAELKRRLEEKVREERAQAKLLIAMGVPFAVMTLFGMTLALSMILWLLHLKFFLAFLISLVVVAGAMAFDTWKHPSPHWEITRFYLAGSIDPTRFATTPAAKDGIVEGWRALGIIDPANLAAQSEKVAIGCFNVILGGPRNIRMGMEQFQAVRAKSDERVESAGVRFLAWLKTNQPITEEELQDLLRKDPSLSKGVALAVELGFVTRRKEGPQRLIEMKE